ncbi:pyruvate formate lyase family protein [Desulfitobacterium sp. PCE1]|uniref:(2S)-3-sulfopropanediol dehydratase n=1 Tax=Desulfitobacterium sp. PCE1 TaxID=146907 RepID=UPI00036BB6D3|nr:pyruvate formate lyase family protein [Desulfitobacterium sp. PCE1]
MSCCEPLVLSPQEMWLEGKMKDEDKGRERTFRRMEAIRKSQILLCTDRARLFTESMKATERKPLILRWALALQHIAENIPVYIGEDDLIVGKGENHPGRCGMLYPEIDGAYLDRMGENICGRPDTPFYVSKEDYKIMTEEIAPYWKDKSFPETFVAALPEDTRTLMFGADQENIYQQFGIIFCSGNFRASHNWVIDYKKVAERGIKDIKKQAQEKLAAIENPFERVEKEPFLQSVIITCDAIVIWAKRYAQSAREMAQKESNPARKAELLQIAEICEWVPENPARTFYEALQTQWFAYMFCRLEQLGAASLSLGRMDQYLYPYYKKDIEEGRMTRDQARELLESVWVNMSEAMFIMASPAAGSFTEGYAHFEGVTIGGQTREGKDATNEVSYLILDSKRGIPINYPDMGVRIHAQTPDKFLRAVTEIIKEGQGYPKLLNDEEIVPLYLAKGVSYEDALDYCIAGCVENRIPNVDTYATPAGAVNFGAAVELTLNNGRMKLYGDYQFGAETGDPRNFTSFEEVMNAYRTQHLYLLKHVLTQQAVLDEVKTKFMAAPMTSMVHDICMEECQDLHHRLKRGLREIYCDAIGYATAADSLAAIKKLVFDNKKLTMGELLDALAVNFEGKEAIRQMCLNAPKYANNDPEADAIAKELEKYHLDYLEEQNKEIPGTVLSLRMVPVTLHIAFGKVVGATPNGRKAGMPLAEGTGASHGCDTKGPTGLLMSNVNSKNKGSKNRQARLLNLKLSPGSVKGEEGTRKLMSLIRTWCDMKLYHIQFNIINRETLLAAQKDPEKYRSLVIRVAGYSAYFTELSKELQDEIIARTEQSL